MADPINPPTPPAPAAPAAPAASAPIVTLPSGNVQESSVERVTREARERVAAGGSAVPEPAPAAPAKPVKAQERHPGDGTFVEKGRIDTAREVGSPKAGRDAPAGDQAEGDGGEGDEVETPPEGTEGDGEQEVVEDEVVETDETDEERQAREAAAHRTVTITGRNNQSFDLELPEDTPREVVDAVRHLRNSAMRADEIRAGRAEIERHASQLAEREFELEMDLPGTLMRVAEETGQVTLEDGSRVDLVDHTVLHLLAQPKVFERLKERVQAMLEDERELRTTRAETASQRTAIREEMRTISEERTRVSANLAEVQATVGAILPTDWTEDRQRVLFRDCLRDLKDHATRNRLQTIPAKDIPAILADRLSAYGINPVEAARRISESTRRNGTAPRRPAPAGAGARGKAPAPREVPPKTGQRFVVSARKKGEAAAIPPGGAGSPAGASALEPPKNADGTKHTMEQRVAWHREQIKKGARRY